MNRRTFVKGSAIAAAGAFVQVPGLARGEGHFYELASRPTNYESVRGTFTTRITPVERFYIRNHFDPPRGEPATWASRWKLEVRGQVGKPRTFVLDDLAKMKQVTVEAVLQ